MSIVVVEELTDDVIENSEQVATENEIETFPKKSNRRKLTKIH